MPTGVHEIIAPALNGDFADPAPRSDAPWAAAAFYAAIALAVVLIVIRSVWPPDEHRLTPDPSAVTQAQ